MFSKTMTDTYMKNCLEQIRLLGEILAKCEAVVIGAGSGLSTAAGFDYTGERFENYFSDFGKEYGIQDRYSGGFYPFPSREVFWAYWSRYIFINRYQKAPISVYENLFKLVWEKDYFVITTNVDHCFQKSGFDKKRLFYTQGDFGLFQCSEPCCQETFDNEKQIRERVAKQSNRKILTELLPICPHCGKPLVRNLRCDNHFVEDKGWHIAANRYVEFLAKHKGQRVLFLELGVGNNTPGIIKYPFWERTYNNKNSFYACVNKDEAVCPKEINRRSICIQEDLGFVIEQLGNTKEPF